MAHCRKDPTVTNVSAGTVHIVRMGLEGHMIALILSDLIFPLFACNKEGGCRYLIFLKHRDSQVKKTFRSVVKGQDDTLLRKEQISLYILPHFLPCWEVVVIFYEILYFLFQCVNLDIIIVQVIRRIRLIINVMVHTDRQSICLVMFLCGCIFCCLCLFCLIIF